MGLGKTITLIALHLHRVAAGHRPDAGRLPGQPARQLGGGDRPVRAGRRRCAGSTAGSAIARGLTSTGSCSRPTAPCGVDHAALAEVGWDLVVADEAQHVKNARSSTAKALRTIPSTGAGRPHRHAGGEQPHRALGDPRLGDARAARQPARVPQGLGRADRVGRASRAKARQFADLIGPFLLRRRKSDPGIAPELPAKTETDHPLGLTREQVVLYEAFVRDTMERIERPPDDQDDPPRAGARAAHRAQADLQPPGALPQAVRRGPADRPLREARPARRAARHGARRGRRRAGLHPVRRDGPAARGAPGARPACPHQFLHGGTPVREREAMVARVPGGRRRRCSCSRSRPAAPAST